MSKAFSAGQIVDQLSAIYDESVANLRTALANFVRDQQPPAPSVRANGVFAYPELRVDYSGRQRRPSPTRAFARLNQPGVYETSIARPELCREYLVDQLEHLARHCKAWRGLRNATDPNRALQ